MGDILNNKITRMVIIILSSVSILLSLISDMEFKWALIMINICTIITLFLKIEKEIPKDLITLPINHVSFGDDIMRVGNLNIDIKSINKVALSIDGDYGYFSLPFNPVESGIVPKFTFLVQEFDTVKSHLKQGLGNVEYIT